jgi:hypothetical protein
MDSFSLSTLVYPLPEVSFTGLETTYCPEAPIDTLYGMPSGGIFSGINVSDDFFLMDSLGFVTPIAPGENISINYTYTDINNCVSTSSQLVEEFYSALNLEFLAEETFYCLNEPNDTISVNMPGGIFTGEGIGSTLNDNSFIFLTDSVGEYLITYSVLDSNLCINTVAQIFTVNDLPEIDLGDDTFLITGETLTLSSGISTGVEYLWSTGAMTPTLEIQNPGFYILTVIDANSGCLASDTIEVFFGTGLNTIAKSPEFILFPNPAYDQIKLLLPIGKIMEIEAIIFDLNGKPLIHKYFFTSLTEKVEVPISIEHLESGTYFLKVGNESVPFVKY